MLVKNVFRPFTTLTGEIICEKLVGRDAGIVIVSLNRPRVKNAVNRALLASLSSALDNISRDKTTRVVILRSTCDAFCAGADLKERIGMSPWETSETVSKFRSVTSQVENVPTPTIAALDGLALGGGLELALACDLRIGATNATFGLVETRLGIIPGAGGTQRLPRITGAAIAKELIFTARIFAAAQAEKYGILNHLVDQNELGMAAFEKALEIGREILPNGPLGVKLAKAAVNKGLQVDCHSGCAIEEACYERIIPSKDRLEGLKAFLEKRSPNYTGE